MSIPLQPLATPCRARTRKARQKQASFLLPDEQQQMLHRALTQQLWNWGFDIREAQGNLLIAYGAERIPPPADVSAHSAYRWNLASGGRLTLWGFGVLVQPSDGPGLLLLRRDGIPRSVPPGAPICDCFDADALAACADAGCAPNALQQLRDLARWISAYEAWAGATQAADYRESSLTRWRELNPSTALTTSESTAFWHSLARS